MSDQSSPRFARPREFACDRARFTAELPQAKDDADQAGECADCQRKRIVVLKST